METLTLLFHQRYIIDNVVYHNINYISVVRNVAVRGQHRTSCVKQCYSICAYILYSIVYNPQKESILYVYIMRV